LKRDAQQKLFGSKGGQKKVQTSTRIGGKNESTSTHGSPCSNYDKKNVFPRNSCVSQTNNERPGKRSDARLGVKGRSQVNVPNLGRETWGESTKLKITGNTVGVGSRNLLPVRKRWGGMVGRNINGQTI